MVKSIRQIAGEFQHSRNTIRKVLKQAEPNPRPSPRARFAPHLGPVQAVIDQILIDDETPHPSSAYCHPDFSAAPRTSTTTRAAMPRCNVICRSTGVAGGNLHPLGHLPGQRLEADFGHIHVDFPDVAGSCRFSSRLGLTANAPFVLALPFERTRRSSKGWWPPSSSSEPCPRKSGGTIPRPSLP